MASDYARRWAPGCARSAPSKDCRCTASRRSPRAAGRRSSSAPTSAATERSPFSGSPSSPTSTVCRCRPCSRRRRRPAAASRRRKLVLDLERLQSVPAEKAGPLARYAATIQGQRGDYNGQVLSIRTDDLRTLAVIYDVPPAMLAEQLIDWGVLDAGRAPRRSGERRRCSVRRPACGRRCQRAQVSRLQAEQPGQQPVDEAAASRRWTGSGRVRPPRRSRPRPARRRCTSSSQAPSRSTARSTAGIRSSDQPWA